jgi:hypothetical protein
VSYARAITADALPYTSAAIDRVAKKPQFIATKTATVAPTTENAPLMPHPQ